MYPSREKLDDHFDNSNDDLNWSGFFDAENDEHRVSPELRDYTYIPNPDRPDFPSIIPRTTIKYLMDSGNEIAAKERHEMNRVLASKVQAGGDDAEEAKWKLVTDNLPMLNYFVNNMRHPASAWEEATSAGLLGLVRAAEKYDPHHESGATFYTYAKRWVVQSVIKNWGDTAHVVRIPTHLQEELYKLSRTEEDMSAYSDPTLVEVAIGLNMDPDKMAYLRHMSSVSELDSDASIEDRTSEAVEDIAAITADMTLVRKALEKLGHRDQEILTRLYGLEGDQETLGEIADSLNVSKSLVRYFRDIAIKRLSSFITKPQCESEENGVRRV